MRKSHYNIKSLCIKRLQPDLKCIKFLDATKFKRLWIILFSHFFYPVTKTHFFFHILFFFLKWSFQVCFLMLLLLLYYDFVINLKNLFMLTREQKEQKKSKPLVAEFKHESLLFVTLFVRYNNLFFYYYIFCNPENTHWNREREWENKEENINKKKATKSS